MALLGQKKSGPWMMDAMSQLMEWQLENIDGGKAEAEEWVNVNKDGLLKS